MSLASSYPLPSDGSSAPPEQRQVLPPESVDPSGPSSDEMWPESRAREVLDQLIRDRQRRSLFRRGARAATSGSAPEGGPSDGADSSFGSADVPAVRRVAEVRAALGAGLPRSRRPGRRTLVTVALVVLVLLGWFGRQWWSRPPSLDTQLPLAAQETSAGSPSSAESSTVAAVPSDGTGATDGAVSDGATPTTAAGTDATAGAALLMVHVAGAVASPGVVQLPASARVVDAVRAAGGLRADADPDRVNLAAPLVDGSRVVVPVLGQAPPVEVGSVPPAPIGTGAGNTAGATGSTGAPIDLNTATVAQLDELPGVGPTTAQAIVDHRDAEGPFTSVDALLDVRGIGDAKLEALRDLVTVG